MLNRAEIDKFSKDAPDWWDESGPFAPLHRLNPVRMAYLKEQICTNYKLEVKTLNALKGLSVLDVGCGGGLVCEPLSRMGANVTGVDADQVAISVAREHAEASGLDISYRNTEIEFVKEKFDVVLALEIIEHVDDPENFVNACIDRLKPNGLIIFSTLNRTAKSYALGIIAAEHILGWVPKGTHDWNKFIKPSELSRMLRNQYMSVMNATGLVFNPFENGFVLSETDLSVNYFISAVATL